MRSLLLPLLLAPILACQPRSSAAPDPAPVTDRTWVLRELEGAPLDSTARERPPTLLLATSNNRATGFAGCNRFSGTYTLGPGTLEFGPLMMTRMACPAMDLETRLSSALTRVRQYRLDGTSLLLEADGTVVARYEAEAGTAR